MRALMVYLVSYVVALIVFGAIDALWLSVMGPLSIVPRSGTSCLPSFALAPRSCSTWSIRWACCCWSVLPALKSGSMGAAIGSSIVLGAVCYATYDLTNLERCATEPCSSPCLISPMARSCPGLRLLRPFWRRVRSPAPDLAAATARVQVDNG